MAEDFSSRRTGWTPAPRPAWVEKVNAEGRCMDIGSVVPLDENSLLNAARGNTGLTDFGDDDWYEPFQVLIQSLDEDAELNLVGRLLTRAELLLYLQAKLQIEDSYKRHPEIGEELIEKPLFIIGQGRTGTSVLQNMLAADPHNGVTTDWEAFYPCPPPEADSYHRDPRIGKTEQVLSRLRRVIPEIDSMHEFRATLPTENIHMHCLNFQSPAWFNSFGGQVAGYNRYMEKRGALSAFQYEKRVLKLLQWKNPRRHWVMKSPASIVHIPDILKVYPDVGLVWTHRDPVKALSSLVNLIGTLLWSRSDRPFIGGALEAHTNAEVGAAMLSLPIDWIESGVLPKERLCSIHYRDFVADPVQVVKTIYRYFGMDITDQGLAAMQKYMDDNPRSSRPTHQYETGGEGRISAERRVYQRYQQYFGVPDEV